MDYLELNTILSFAACETRRCVEVTIVDDLVDEPNEIFHYTLGRTIGLDPRISLNPVDGVVEIIDNDGNILCFMLMCVAVHFSSIPPQFQLLLAMSSQYTLHLRDRGW